MLRLQKNTKIEKVQEKMETLQGTIAFRNETIVTAKKNRLKL